jgi:hypothetical protein
MESVMTSSIMIIAPTMSYLPTPLLKLTCNHGNNLHRPYP